MTNFEYFVPVGTDDPLMARLLQREPPTREEELALTRKARRGLKKARWELVLRHARLAFTIARSYYRPNGSVAINDLFAVALLAMFEKTRRYDPRLGRFSSYAGPEIRRRLMIHHADYDRAHRLPVNFKQAQLTAFKLIGGEEAMDRLNPEEVAKIVEVSIQTARRLKFLAHNDLPLDGAIQDGAEGTLGELVADPSAITSSDDLNRQDNQEMLEELLCTLSERDRSIIERRWGVGGLEPLTLRELGRLHHLTRERIRQIEFRAMRQLRRRARNSESPGRLLRKVA
ncbi:MAG: sigma-70 family RNA polymerase sigma factor [Opitutaceae bacterium]|nr:sigma-70 family RNA polymerase sigma factor [Opitutaceae bacterium]